MPSMMDFDTGGIFTLGGFPTDSVLTLTIKNVTFEHFEKSNFGGPEDKIVLHFEEVAKKLPLNATRREDCTNLFGSADMVGKKVKLVRGPGKGGKETIRVQEAD